jgi:hypothetical protein
MKKWHGQQGKKAITQSKGSFDCALRGFAFASVNLHTPCKPAIHTASVDTLCHPSNHNLAADFFAKIASSKLQATQHDPSVSGPSLAV